MSALPPLSVDEFRDFFEHVHGHRPFPWQDRLLRQVVSGGWPRMLDLPTGSGKTATLDVAVFALALATGVRRSAALRIVYVVDRRTIVDQAYERAERLRHALESGGGILERVRRRLAQWTDVGPPLQTALLRGGIPRDDGWAARPDQPLIAVSTVDQVGSRLLFRGYGISDLMRPVHAGLLGNDVLFLLDEVHLSQPFKETLTAIEGRYRAWAEHPLPSPFTVVEFSATSRAQGVPPFRLSAEDKADPVLAVRLSATKRASVTAVPKGAFIKEIAKRVGPMLEPPGATVAVVVNRVATARAVYGHLRSVIPADTSLFLMTGRMRPMDRDAIEQELIPRVRAGRQRTADAPRTVVVATQTIEAGADFDFDGLVTECASLDALRQRFGRLDRLGELRGAASAAIVARQDTLKDDPVYGASIGATFEWLQQQATDGVVDFGLDALRVPEDASDRGLLPAVVHAPVLLPAHLDAWVQTSPSPVVEPDVSLWLHGPQRGLADIQLIWRSDLSLQILQSSSVAAPGGSPELVAGLLEALPPSTGEAMSVPFLAVRRWLEGRRESDVSDVEGAADPADEDGRDEASREPWPAVLWVGDESRVIGPADLRPGQTIVVPATYGGIEAGNWAPGSSEPVRDIAEAAHWRARATPVLRLHPTVSAALGMAAPPIPASADAERVDDRGQVFEWLMAVDDSVLPVDVRPIIAALRSDRRARVQRVDAYDDGGAPSEYFVLSGPRRAGHERVAGSIVSDSAESSFTGVNITLADHMERVSRRVAAYAASLGLPMAVVQDLGVAGAWHDAGKADTRFQRWLQGGSAFRVLTQPEPLAKGTVSYPTRLARSQARERSGYPAGGRHECASVALMNACSPVLQSETHDWPLVLHLVASHHGWARPFVPWVADEEAVEITVQVRGVRAITSSSHGLERLDSGVAERFWLVVRQYGWWGLAWLEAMLRLADHVESAREQEMRA